MKKAGMPGTRREAPATIDSATTVAINGRARRRSRSSSPAWVTMTRTITKATGGVKYCEKAGVGMKDTAAPSAMRPIVSQNGQPAATCPSGLSRDESGTKNRSEEHTSELQSLMRISYAVFCLKKKKKQ